MSGTIKILEIQVSPHPNKIIEENVYHLLNKVDKIFEALSHRNLTILGKIPWSIPCSFINYWHSLRHQKFFSMNVRERY